MKKISILLTLLLAFNLSFGQTNYNVTSNASFSANCSNCTFNIASGVTLTINAGNTFNNCTFNGGTIAVQSNITCQPCSFNNNTIAITNKSINPNSGTTSFTNVNLTANGSSAIYANTQVNISNSTFTFNNNSYFNNNGGQLEMSNSTIRLNDSAYLNANAGPVNLKNASKIIAGNGLLSSKAYIKINGPALNIYDNASSIILANYNNSYFNWSSYNSISNNKTYSTTYPSAASTMNCGSTGQNACPMWSSPTVYGPSVFAYNGVSSFNMLLPVVLSSFSVANNSNYANINWSTAQEMNTAYFAIERSSNGADWQTAGTTTAKGNLTTAALFNSFTAE